MSRWSFGATWWGRAWVEALEHRARLDPNRLPRGRTYARKGRVLSVSLRQGEIHATVVGNRPSPYLVRVRVRTYSDEEWDRLLAAIAGRAAHAAALLDGELDPAIVEDAHAAGIELLPDAGDLQPRCSCPDWADPCKHAAAVCYLVAKELDADPFALLELRGRDRQEVLAGVRRLRRSSSGEIAAAGLAAGEPDPDRGTPADEAWVHTPGQLPAVPRPPRRPGGPAPWPVDPPDGLSFTAAGLRALAADAAERAWHLARGEARSGLDLNADADLARRAAAALGTDRWATLARRAALSPSVLTHRALAWRHAGTAALAILDESSWRPPLATMAQARNTIIANGAPPGDVRVAGNRLTLARAATQLRLGRDGQWWRFHKRGGRWELAAAPADVPDALVGAGEQVDQMD